MIVCCVMRNYEKSPLNQVLTFVHHETFTLVDVVSAGVSLPEDPGAMVMGGRAFSCSEGICSEGVIV